MTPPRLQIGLIGAGSMGALHARVITQSLDADLACVVDPSENAGDLIAERFRTQYAPDLDGFEGLDAVIIASPTATHVEWALRALRSGTPALVEKPLSEDASAARILVDEARNREVPLMCGFLERYNPALLTALEIIDEPIHLTAVRHSPYVPRIATGVAHDLLIHDVDVVLRMTGRLPDRLTANLAYCHPKSDQGAEDIAEVTLQYEGEMLASLSASRVSQHKVRTLMVAEIERLVEVDLVRQDVTVYRHVGNAPLDDDGPGYRQQTIIDIPTIHQPREALASQLERFVAVVRGELDAGTELASLLGPHLVIADVALAAAERSSSKQRLDE